MDVEGVVDRVSSICRYFCFAGCVMLGVFSKSNETLKHQTTDRQRELRDIEATLPRKNQYVTTTSLYCLIINAVL